tara:strand:+ start:223 stop:417 length:195 start_codon:yes stop_codon:yes gene_type:complete
MEIMIPVRTRDVTKIFVLLRLIIDELIFFDLVKKINAAIKEGIIVIARCEFSTKILLVSFFDKN